MYNVPPTILLTSFPPNHWMHYIYMYHICINIILLGLCKQCSQKIRQTVADGGIKINAEEDIGKKTVVYCNHHVCLLFQLGLN
jgi:hypothetical protein